MPRRPAAPSAADVLDELRQLVEADGRSVAAIARGLDPPMSRSQLHRCLNSPGLPVSTAVRIAAGLDPPATLAVIAGSRSRPG